ncbi:MAG: hypothetical protein LC781_00390 [Actinobacteria bacterium]|nr:hypothetical protein [Actinomycetota bacterium]
MTKDRCIEKRQRGTLRMELGLKVGERAPYFRALAAGSGREVSLRTCAGRRLVLIFHAQNTAWAAEQVNRAVRGRYLSSEEVMVASVVDLSLVPPLYWLTASVMIGQAYEKAAREVPSEVRPHQPEVRRARGRPGGRRSHSRRERRHRWLLPGKRACGGRDPRAGG